MKKILSITAILMLTVLVFASCGNKNNSSNNTMSSKQSDATQAQSQSNSNKESGGVDMFTGKIDTKWSDVQSEYQKLEEEAKKEINESKEITSEEVKKLTEQIRDDYEKIKGGITSANKQTAMEMYKAGCKLEALGERSQQAKNHEIVKHGENAKAFVKHLYGEGNTSFKTVTGNLESGISNIGSFAAEKWNEFLNFFKVG